MRIPIATPRGVVVVGCIVLMACAPFRPTVPAELEPTPEMFTRWPEPNPAEETPVPVATTTAPVPAGTPIQVATTESSRRPWLRLPATEPPTLDPGLASDPSTIEIVSALFEGLLVQAPNGSITPGVAESFDVSDDGLMYTFHLRGDAKWTDGRPVTATDFVWAWRRLVDPRTASDYAAVLFSVKNATKINRDGADPGSLGVAAPNDRTLTVTLEDPAAHFPVLAATWALSPVRGDVSTAFGDRWTEPATIVTNGPFRLARWLHDRQIVLERNGAYWGPRTPLDGAEYSIFAEGRADEVLAAYDDDRLDSTLSAASFGLPPADAGTGTGARPADGVREFPTSATVFLTINVRRTHLADVRVRRALGMALDRTAIVRDVLGRSGQPARSIHPDGVMGRNPDAWPEEDPAEARRLLADAGFPDGAGFPELSVAYDSHPQWRRLVDYLERRWWDSLGIVVRRRPMEPSSFQKWRRSDDWRSTGDIARGGWVSDYDDPHDWFNVLWDSREDPEAFDGGWRNDDLDALVRRAQAERSPRPRLELYAQAEEIMAREYPHIPLFHPTVRGLVKPYVRGFVPTRVLGLAPLRLISINRR